MHHVLSYTELLQDKKDIWGERKKTKPLGWKQADTCQNNPWQSPFAVNIVLML